jgi:hypothetical protein
MLLAEIPTTGDYGRGYGLIRRTKHVCRPGRLPRCGSSGGGPARVKPLRWCFPIVGCFRRARLVRRDEAVQHKLELEAMGYDALVRPASAYSTGGWFPDPVLSTMLGGGDDAFPELANVILHESVHATILVPDQPFFNESIATYVADTLTDNWIVERFVRAHLSRRTLGKAVTRARRTRPRHVQPADEALLVEPAARREAEGEEDDHRRARRGSAHPAPAQQRVAHRGPRVQRRRRRVDRCPPCVRRSPQAGARGPDARAR